MKTAKFIRDIVGMRDASAYELSEPLDGHSIVIVSAAVVMFTDPETYVFPATAESLERNDPSSWCELEGSYRGGLDKHEALRRAGYEVVS